MKKSLFKNASGIICLSLCILLGLTADVKNVHASGRISFSDTAKQNNLDTIASRLVRLHLSEKHQQKEMVGILKKMQPDGSFSDIDYADTALAIWKPLQHLQRLVSMSIAYRTLKGPYDHDRQILAKIITGLNFYRVRKPASANWWYRDIGSPQVMMITLLLLKGEIDPNLLLQYSAALKDVSGKPSYTGKNRTWVSEITIYKGCIENDYALVEKGFNSIASTLFIAGEHEEGIQIDHSFHQHHAQLYEGGYGLSIISDYAKYMRLSQGTIFSGLFTAQKKKILSDMLLQGHQLLGYRKAIDFGSVGRNITRKDGIENISDTVLMQFNAIDPLNSAAYQKWESHLRGAAFAVPGNTYFWNSDIMAQHGANYYLSAKVISDRTYGTESLNGENIKGYHLPLGATNIMVSGQEYFNIFPVWDWSRIPGTTAEFDEQTASLINYQIGKNRFAGGVSDGQTGAIAYEHFYQGLSAKKSYFFINNRMICLGAGITGRKSNPVITSVNQCLANGKVTLGSTDAESDLTEPEKTITGLKWLHHDNVGYIFPDGGKITVRKTVQTGSWHAINTSGSDRPLSMPVFSAWFDHGNSPVNASYCYTVVPDIKLNEFKKALEDQTVEVLRNDTLVQAVKYHDQIWCVFYRPGKLTCPDGLIITSEVPSLVMTTTSKDKFIITVSDPLHRQQSIALSINRKIEGPGITPGAGFTSLLIPLAKGNLAGQPVTVRFSKPLKF